MIAKKPAPSAPDAESTPIPSPSSRTPASQATPPVAAPLSVTIDDDPLVAHIVERATGMRTLAFGSSAAYLAHVSSDAAPKSAFFVDIHLGMHDSGIDLLPTLRTANPYTPILVITAEPHGAAVGHALAAGANDFVRKPIDPEELAARLRARTGELAERNAREVVAIGDVTANLALGTVCGPSGVSHLSNADVRLLVFLGQANGAIVGREELKRKVWGYVAVSENALDKKLHEVRAALRDVGSGAILQSAYGRGVRLTSQAAVRAAG
jgi:DNA-binding response OmpR family regulator